MSVLCKKFSIRNRNPGWTKDAKEVAKKLIKTGAIRAIKSSIEKEKIKEEKINSGFKRSQVYLILDRLAWLPGLQQIFKLPHRKQDLFISMF
jgi:diphthamide synthase (EF-2-diphthine--ammonia ligase)